MTSFVTFAFVISVYDLIALAVVLFFSCVVMIRDSIIPITAD